MRKIPNAFDQLILDASEELSHKLRRSNSTVKWYRVYWRQMQRQLAKNGTMDFNSQIGQQYLLGLFGKFDYSTLSKCNKDM